MLISAGAQHEEATECCVGMRVVVVSDRHLSAETLVNALRYVPTAHVAAMVNNLAAASPYCCDGTADAVLVDAATMPDHLSSLNFSREEAVRTVAAKLSAFGDLEYGNRPWELAAERLDELSLREREVLVLLGLGLSNRRISRVLGLAERTVKSHVGRILAKLSLESRLQAGLAALMWIVQESGSSETD